MYGVLLIIGGMLVYLVVGCFYLFSNLSVYVLSYMYQFDKNVSYEFAFYVDTAMKIVINPGYFLGITMLQKFNVNPKLIIMLGGALAITGVLISSITKTLLNFVIFYGLFFGLGSGIIYLVPV
jgi:hypothetical protein